MHRYIAEEANLQYPEKDFTDGYKVSPNGILIYDPCGMDPYHIESDKHGHERIVLPSKSSLFIRLRFNMIDGKVVKKSYLHHGDDIEWALQRRFVDRGEPVPSDVYMDSDDGSDAKYINSDKTKVVISRIAKKHDIAVFIMSGPSHNNSSENDIEPCWAGPKNALHGMIIPDRFEDDDSSPAKQSSLTSEERIYKERAIFETVGHSILTAWKDLKWSDRPIIAESILPQVFGISPVFRNSLRLI